MSVPIAGAVVSIAAIEPYGKVGATRVASCDGTVERDGYIDFLFRLPGCTEHRFFSKARSSVPDGSENASDFISSRIATRHLAEKYLGSC